ncbi:DUF6529 family protein [Streptomyces sp. NPDC007355]|uniref:DUF6529 family protein n=1 Tax=Streptomyces sp. NPDC007355 TaxID=3364778 RepID=UPI00368D1A70
MASPRSLPPTSPPPPPAPPAASGPGAAQIVVPLLLGAAVAVALGVYGRTHAPSGVSVNVAGFTNPGSVKSWLATGAAALAVVQLLTAQAMWGKLPVASDLASASWPAALHRWSGRLAFLAAVPVAAHCLYALGYQGYDTRTLTHSLAGCFFFGAFTTKMLLLRTPRLPGWALPLIGGAVFTALIVLWFTSALWFFTLNGIHY